MKKVYDDIEQAVCYYTQDGDEWELKLIIPYDEYDPEFTETFDAQ